MEKGFWKKVIDFITSNFTELLTFLILLFIFRPYDRGGIYTVVWQILLTAAFIASVFNCHHHYAVKTAMLILGIPAIVFNWLSVYEQNPYYLGIFLTATALFILVSAGSIIQRVILNARVTLETLRGAICVYFMIAFAFAFIYYLIEFLLPGSFHLIYSDAKIYDHNHYISEMIYFSFVTLLSIGYGDITAIRDVGQTFTILEGIIGQFYVAILVARLVAVYTLMSKDGHLDKK